MSRKQKPRSTPNPKSGNRKAARTRHEPRPSRQDGPRRDTSPRPSASGASDVSPGGSYWLYGRHALHAALDNPERRFIEIRATDRAVEGLAPRLDKRQLSCRLSKNEEISALLPQDAVHQGMAAKVHPLPALDLTDVIPADPDAPCRILLLDQVTDPHNLGAILRSAAAFGVSAIIVTDRNAPPVSGVIGKSACGALDIVPLVQVANLARALDDLAENGFWRIGLDGHTDKALHEISPGHRVALVLGAEGKGMRRLTMEKCDFIAKLPISPKMESLNVSNAAAIALYELARQQG